jgi:hypothetical protein
VPLGSISNPKLKCGWRVKNSLHRLKIRFLFKCLSKEKFVIAKNSSVKILEVVRSHYDSLTLKLHESLDAYERYAERPPVAAFLSSIVNHVLYFSNVR